MSSHSPFIFLFFQLFNELPFPHFFHTFLIFQSSSIPPFSFSYFSFTISAFSYFAVVGKIGNRAKKAIRDRDRIRVSANRNPNRPFLPFCLLGRFPLFLTFPPFSHVPFAFSYFSALGKTEIVLKGF